MIILNIHFVSLYPLHLDSSTVALYKVLVKDSENPLSYWILIMSYWIFLQPKCDQIIVQNHITGHLSINQIVTKKIIQNNRTVHLLNFYWIFYLLTGPTTCETLSNSSSETSGDNSEYLLDWNDIPVGGLSRSDS
jgi:hypothetical protein